MFSSNTTDHGHVCKMCRHPGADVRIQPCGCEIHARCVPLNLIVSETGLRNNETNPVPQNTLLCPSCCATSVSKIYICPLETTELDRAVELRKQALRQKQNKTATMSAGAALNAQFFETQAETSYLMLSHNQGSSAMSNDHEYQRIGRWTDEEISFVDFLVEAFDNGRIPVEHGLKLNEFLPDVLLCKSSRLTKKMKNARLSGRSYIFIYPVPRLDVELMSSLERKFLDSIISEASRLELRFNLSRLWRSHLSNLCLQVGSPLLDAHDWISSLEESERRASDTEERLRKARRRRMGLALKTDTQNDEEGVMFSGIPVQRPQKKLKEDISEHTPMSSSAMSSFATSLDNRSRIVTDPTDSSNQSTSSEQDSEHEFISNMLDLGPKHSNTDAGDYSNIFDDLAEDSAASGISGFGLVRKNCGPFLNELIQYIETNDLPFQHVDVWVPSYRPTSENARSELRLFHAGYGTCHHTESPLVMQLDEYGEYSTRFSFPSGVGLPGRVFASGRPSWERRLDEADPKVFERAGGARVYGVKTGFGFPLRTSVVGLIVVSMYSIQDLPENPGIMNKCVTDLSKLAPEPKWKLVVEMGGSSLSSSSQSFRSCTPALPSQATAENPTEENMEHKIASILGEFMPLADIPAPGESTLSGAPPMSLVPHFMSLRLLLLRHPDRRFEEDNEILEIIKRSYQGYSKDARRSKRDIAFLLVKDWQFLMNKAAEEEARKPAARPACAGQYQCHVMEIPGVSTFIPNGAPVKMPRALPYINPNKDQRSSLLGVQPNFRRGSKSLSDTTGSNLNIVENST